MFKSFCLRDRGKFGNEGPLILLKIGTQSRHVDFCNMPKFQVQRRFFFSRVLDISPSGVPRGRFSVQFWPLFNLPFSNVQLISDKTKTIFVKPYPWMLMGENIRSREIFVRLGLSSQLGPIWSIWKAPGNGLFLRPHIFHAHVLYHKVLVSLQSSALSLVISRKNTKIKAFLLRKNLHDYD